jgi:protein O-mannosyl-transferase
VKLDRRLGAPLLVLALAISASITGLRNDFVSDDIPLIVGDARTHSFAHVDSIFTSSYWPEPPFYPDLYRPLASLSFTVQWALGGGSPLIFRVLAYLLYGAVSVGVLLLALRLLPAAVALGVGVLFAVHPVHVEAVALGVNQAELWVGLLSLFATLRYLDARRAGWLEPGDWAAIGAAYLAACLFKEHGIVLPALLAAAELTLIRGADPKERVHRLWPGYAALAALGAGFLLIRTLVLRDFVGSFTADALVGQGMAGRTLTMLQVVPEWLRLLAWPRHLQADYSLIEIEQATRWGLVQSAALAMLLSLAALAWFARRAAPAIPFGLLWAALAILPVSNVLVPTGIVLAERSLFLPSVGFVLAAGGVTAYLLTERPPLRAPLVALGLGLALLGLGRSAYRHLDYRHHVRFWSRTLEDAPLSHKAYHALGQIRFQQGLDGQGFAALHTAVALHPGAYKILHELADRFRDRGHCQPALYWYAESLKVEPDQAVARLSRINCLVALGREEQAQREAAEARAFMDARERSRPRP